MFRAALVTIGSQSGVLWKVDAPRMKKVCAR